MQKLSQQNVPSAFLGVVASGAWRLDGKVRLEGRLGYLQLIAKTGSVKTGQDHGNNTNNNKNKPPTRGRDEDNQTKHQKLPPKKAEQREDSGRIAVQEEAS